MANLLTNLAVLTTRPDERYLAKVASRARAAVEESQAAEALRARGFRHQAAVHTELAFMHLSCARNLAREWTPDAETLIRVVRGSWQLGFFGLRDRRKIGWRSFESVDYPLASPLRHQFLIRALPQYQYVSLRGVRSSAAQGRKIAQLVGRARLCQPFVCLLAKGQHREQNFLHGGRGERHAWHRRYPFIPTSRGRPAARAQAWQFDPDRSREHRRIGEIIAARQIHHACKADGGAKQEPSPAARR